MSAILPLRLAGVSFAAGGRTIIPPLDLTLEAGASTVILGANGAGKSVLMRLMHGLLAPSTGRVAWNADGPRRRQAMVFQRPVMLRRSALANVVYALDAAGVPVGQQARLAREALQEVGLSHLAGRAARVLSGGEQQRLALARAWALHPEVLFLDEPTANLDPGATGAVERIVDALHAGGCKIIMTTHDMNQARRLADEVIFLHDGVVIERGDAARFFDRPQTETATAFLEGRLLW